MLEQGRYSLPENDDDSEEDCDEDAAEELTHPVVTNSGCDERDGAIAEAVDISEKRTEPDHQTGIHQKLMKVNGAIVSRNSRI